MTRSFLADDHLGPAENRQHAQKAILTWLLEQS